MDQVLSFQESDVGRVAQSEDGCYLVRVLEIVGIGSMGSVRARVTDLKTGEEISSFTIIGGSRPMYWVEEPAKSLNYPEMMLDISTAVHASRHVNQPRTVFEVMAYLTSETGECADWLVNPDRQKEDLLGECADVIICALDLALRHKKETSGLDGQELADEVVNHLNDLLKVKAEKWMDKHAKV